MNERPLKTVHVSAAIIFRDSQNGGKEVFATERVAVVDYDYPDFHLCMECFAARVSSGELKLLERKSAAWLDAQTLCSVKWLPAGEMILEKVKELLLRS